MANCDFGKDVRSAKITICKFDDLSSSGRKIKPYFSPFIVVVCMQEVVDLLADEYGWSDSVSNLSNKLQRESLRYTEAVQLADVLGFEIVWRKRGDR